MITAVPVDVPAIARTRGVIPASDYNKAVEDRRERARAAQARLPGIAP